jgi:hypothetical protein
MGVRMSNPVGDKHRQVLDLIRAAGPKGITTGEIAAALGITRDANVQPCLMPLDPVYEECEPNRAGGKRLRLFWCGKEESDG